jgi:hypothetical protein
MNAALSWIEPRGHLFVLGHMRSYSSLLCHILGSHPEIDGYCETHIKYRWHLDLLRLRRRVMQLTGEPLRGRYVLDKMLHDYPLAGSILRSTRARGIVLLREPRATVRSIMNMGLRYSRSIAWYRDVDAVAAYYERRLASLVRLADQMPGRVLFVEAERLLSATEPVLQDIDSFLALGQPLQSSYRQFAHTGEAHYGDPSESIRSGNIADARAAPAGIILPETVISHLERLYRACAASLRERCSSRSS